jgi:thiamine pyrophosphate-dependent acetolactate synthase large subunit-like protein
VVEAKGGAGETVEDTGEVSPALDQALASGVQYLVNVILDASVAYPRRSSLA